MGDKAYINITNTPEVQAALANVEKVAKKYLKQGINAGMSPVVSAAKKGLTSVKRTGLLRKAMSKKIKVYSSGIVVGIVGADRDVKGELGKKRIVPANYSHLVEAGTKAHKEPRKNITHPGAKAKPFLRPAWDATKEQVPDIVAAKIKEGLEKELKK